MFEKTFFEVFKQIWNAPVYVQANGASVTIGVFILGIFFFFLSFLLAGFLSRQLEKRVLSHIKDMDELSRVGLRKIAYYLLLFTFLLFFMGLLNVPLTILTVLGGALAIGVGLGGQNIMNNFISGIVIILEKPVRVGDVIEINENGLRGRVQDIGARSTKVLSINNTTIIVPNSRFLEREVLNWTLSDRVIRQEVKVGVAYGSPVEKVRDILLKIAQEDKKILSYPSPVVLFENFGESSLDFLISFHCYMDTFLDLRVILSDLRFLIDEKFRENSIVVAFPQRDLYIKNNSLKIDLTK